MTRTSSLLTSFIETNEIRPLSTEVNIAQRISLHPRSVSYFLNDHSVRVQGVLWMQLRKWYMNFIRNQPGVITRSLLRPAMNKFLAIRRSKQDIVCILARPINLA